MTSSNSGNPGVNVVREHVYGYLHKPPVANHVWRKSGVTYLTSSQRLEIDGYLVLRVSRGTFVEQANGDLHRITHEVTDEFYLYYPGRGWKHAGNGRGGKLTDPVKAPAEEAP